MSTLLPVPRARRPFLAAAAVVVVLVPAVLVVACFSDPEVRAGASTPSAAPPARATADGVRYSFDGGLSASVPDAAGRLPLTAREAAGGTLSNAPSVNGLAVRFPAPCPHYGADSCQRAILESSPADFLNPGSSPFEYGASILMAPGETSKGANVVQKGYSVGDSQFKLQVDGAAGRPSCVLVGRGDHIYLAESSVTVADGQWHDIRCARSNRLLTIAVDGAVRGQETVPSALSIVNVDPLCIGGKGTSANNDQFHGVLDDVYVTLKQRLID